MAIDFMKHQFSQNIIAVLSQMETIIKVPSTFCLWHAVEVQGPGLREETDRQTDRHKVKAQPLMHCVRKSVRARQQQQQPQTQQEQQRTSKGTAPTTAATATAAAAASKHEQEPCCAPLGSNEV
jgi:hypothetical protein